jgi:hypothetical protein
VAADVDATWIPRGCQVATNVDADVACHVAADWMTEMQWSMTCLADVEF